MTFERPERGRERDRPPHGPSERCCSPSTTGAAPWTSPNRSTSSRSWRGPLAPRSSGACRNASTTPIRAPTSAAASSLEARDLASERGRPGHRRRRARAERAEGHGGGPRSCDRRPHAADPGHFRPARADPRRPRTGRAGAARVSAAASDAGVDPPRAAGSAASAFAADLVRRRSRSTAA